MRKTLRVFLWLIKGTLLFLALAALILWPLSRGRIMYVNARQCIVRPEWGEGRWYEALCWDGRVAVSASRLHFASGLIPGWILTGAQTHGDALAWEHDSRPRAWEDNQFPSRWGPFRWTMYAPTEKGFYRAFAAPLWLAAVVFGAWPLTSIVFALRRRAKRRRAALEGCCRRCGYDLRATPTPGKEGGGLLAVCPECGRESQKPWLDVGR